MLAVVPSAADDRPNFVVMVADDLGYGGLGTDQPQPDDHGFDHWFATTGFAMPTHLNPFNFVLNGEEMGPVEGYACQLLSDEAVRWMTDLREPDRPFLMVVGYHEPHEAIASPPELTAT